MGLLRLLTNPRAMGVDVIGQSQAWKVYRELRRDFRVSFVSEPPGIEELWCKLTQNPQPATHLRTDAYLQAFAQLARMSVVSFDQAFRRVAEAQVLE